MKPKLISILLLLIFTGMIPIVSCIDQCDGPCGCYPVFEKEDFSITQIDVETLFRSNNNQPIDTSLYYFYKTLYIGIWASKFILVNESIKNGTVYFPSFLTPAVANCSQSETFSMESVSGLKLINRNAVQLTEDIYWSEGDNITDSFVVTLNFQKEYPIDAFVKTKHRFQKEERFYLRFKNEPSLPTDLFFDIILELDNGKIFTFSGNSLKISP
jgi:hypothetical protein